MHRPELTDDLDQGNARLNELTRGNVRSFDPGQTIITAEEEHGFVYRLASGWCARVRHLPDGRSQTFAILLPGDLFGVKSLFLTSQFDEVVAVDAVVAQYVSVQTLRASIADDQPLFMRLSWQLLEDDRRVHNWLLALGRGRAEEKIALMLLDLRGRLALANDIPPGATQFNMPMTQSQMGDLLGLTPVHVNRTLQALRAQGVAEINRRTVKVLDLARLHRIAYPMLDVFEKNRPEFGSVPSRPGREDRVGLDGQLLLRNPFSASVAQL